MGNIARILARSERAQAKAAFKAGDELGYNRNYTRGLIKFGQEGMTPEARAARAREMGFDTDMYRGVTGFGSQSGPGELASSRGHVFFTTEDPEFANRYAGGPRPRVFPLKAKTGQVWRYDSQEDINKLWDSISAQDYPQREQTKLTRAVQSPASNWEYVESLSGAIKDAGFNGFKMTEDGATTYGFYDQTPLRSPFATFDPARAHRRDLLAGVVPAAAAVGAGALAMQPGEAEAAQPVAPPALARAVARQLEKDVGARRREAQGGLGYRIGQLATGLAQDAIADPFAALDPTMGFATAVRDDVKTDMDAARARKTSEIVRRAVVRAAPRVKRGAFSGRDTE